MQQILDKSNFDIILKSEDTDYSSEYWQEQCCQLYGSICRSIPDGWIEPLELEGSEGERSDIIHLFSTLAVYGITGKVFIIILDIMKTWLEYRPTAEIELNCPDGIKVKISKMPLDKLSKFFEENPQLSVCEGLNCFINSNE